MKMTCLHAIKSILDAAMSCSTAHLFVRNFFQGPLMASKLALGRCLMMVTSSGMVIWLMLIRGGSGRMGGLGTS